MKKKTKGILQIVSGIVGFPVFFVLCPMIGMAGYTFVASRFLGATGDMFGEGMTGGVFGWMIAPFCAGAFTILMLVLGVKNIRYEDSERLLTS